MTSNQVKNARQKVPFQHLVCHSHPRHASFHCERRETPLPYLSLSELLPNVICIFCASPNMCISALPLIFFKVTSQLKRQGCCGKKKMNVFFTALICESHSSLVRALKNRLQVNMGIHAGDECETS